MWYMMTHLWLWLAFAFLVGALVGWMTCGRKRT